MEYQADSFFIAQRIDIHVQAFLIGGLANRIGVYAPAIETCLSNGIAALPAAVQQTVLLNVSEQDFAA